MRRGDVLGAEFDWIVALRRLVEGWLGGAAWGAEGGEEPMRRVKRRALEEIRQIFEQELNALGPGAGGDPQRGATLHAFRAVLEVVDREIQKLDPDPEGSPPALRKVPIQD